MPLPQVPEKLTEPSALTARRLLATRPANFELDDEPGLLLCFHAPTLRYLKRRFRGRRIDSLLGRAYMLRRPPRPIVVCGELGLGAPAAVAALEDFVARGVRRVVSMGLAAGLGPGRQAGDVIVASRAVRDEGTSHHYLPAARSVESSEALTRRLTDAAAAAGLEPAMGAVWTTDAPFRETMLEVTRYQQEGVLAVDMETAALLAAGRYRDIEVAASLVVGDRFDDRGWVEAPDMPGLERRLETLAQAAISTLQ